MSKNINWADKANKMIYDKQIWIAEMSPFVLVINCKLKW